MSRPFQRPHKTKRPRGVKKTTSFHTLVLGIAHTSMTLKRATGALTTSHAVPVRPPVHQVRTSFVCDVFCNVECKVCSVR
jgi:hypothetical protein